MSSGSNIVSEWLRSLQMGQYADSFMDNGYDDLEICKQVGEPDLDAIGVFNPSHRTRLLEAVRGLREEGAASVYFTLEEAAAVATSSTGEDLDTPEEDSQQLQAASSSSSSRSKHCCAERGNNRGAVGALGGTCGGACAERGGRAACGGAGGGSPVASTPADSVGSNAELRFLDEYEEGKAELVNIPKVQLRVLLKDKIGQDGIRLTCLPYSTSTGDRGYLEGLASRYADEFNTHYQDVLEHLEDLRRKEWDDMAPRLRGLGMSPSTPDSPLSVGRSSAGAGGGPVTGPSLTSSQSQPIYVPGKYSPSSCLSDKEEDEIYGFGYGVYGKQMLARQQQQAKLLASSPQGCLTPRSVYFYEFPPSEWNGSQQTTKKKLGLGKLLKGLKVHRKEKGSPRHSSKSKDVPDQRSSGSDSGPILGTPVGGLPSLGTPESDRLRLLPIERTNERLQETIQRLKAREVQLRKEKFAREHEEFLREIRQGLLQYSRGNADGKSSSIFYTSGDDNYMYDDEVCPCPPFPTPGDRGPSHWYDEPPYESDPEDFLLRDDPLQSCREAFFCNFNPPLKEEDVISLRTAGDISIRRGDLLGSNSYLHHHHHHHPQPPLPPPPTSIQWASAQAEVDFRNKVLPPPPESRSTDSLDRELGVRFRVHHVQPTQLHQQVHHHHHHQHTHRHQKGHQELYGALERLSPLSTSSREAAACSGSRRRHPSSGSSEPYSRLYNSPRHSRESGDYHLENNSGVFGGVLWSRGRESCGDYASSDVNSVGSRLSGVSIETNRSESQETGDLMDSPRPARKNGVLRKLRTYASRSAGAVPSTGSAGSEEGPSPSQSSDYEDQEDIEQRLDQGPGRGPASLVGRMRGLRHDMQKRISRLRPSRSSETTTSTTSAPVASTSSMAAGTATSGSSGEIASLSGNSVPTPQPNGTVLLEAASGGQATLGSNRSSLSGEEPEPIYSGPFMGKARALVDCIPSPYDRDALRFKKGDVIDVITMNPSGLWKGRVHNRVGHFKFINVEVMPDKPKHKNSKLYGRKKSSKRGRPKSVEELLQRISLEEHISVFVLNGYEDLELFKDIEEADLDYLGIINPEHRAKILTAVELLHDYDSSDTPETDDPASSTDGSASQGEYCKSTPEAFQRVHFPRDSGFYASGDHFQSGGRGGLHYHYRHHHAEQPGVGIPQASDSCFELSNNLDVSCAGAGKEVEDGAILDPEEDEIHKESPAEPSVVSSSTVIVTSGRIRGGRGRTRIGEVEDDEDDDECRFNIPVIGVASTKIMEDPDRVGIKGVEGAEGGRTGSEKSSDSGISTSSRSPPSLPRNHHKSSNHHHSLDVDDPQKQQQPKHLPSGDRKNAFQ